VLPRRELLRQIDELRRENQQLKEQQVQTAAIARENDQLRELLGWQRQVPWKLKLANVVMQDPSNWWLTLQIDLGSRDGIQKNQPVLTTEGLVGRVSAVNFISSQVTLVGDPNCRVSAMVENATHDIGVLEAGSRGSSLARLGKLAGSAYGNLKPGQEVITSGLGGVFPKGIPIGKVVDAQSIAYGAATEANVKLNANLGALEQVWVLFK
jgi:rod shape-determining protein MreC